MPELNTTEQRRIWGLEAAVPPNTHFRGMTPEQIEALTPEEKAALNIAAIRRGVFGPATPVESER